MFLANLSEIIADHFINFIEALRIKVSEFTRIFLLVLFTQCSKIRYSVINTQKKNHVTEKALVLAMSSVSSSIFLQKYLKCVLYCNMIAADVHHGGSGILILHTNECYTFTSNFE